MLTAAKTERYPTGKNCSLDSDRYGLFLRQRHRYELFLRQRQEWAMPQIATSKVLTFPKISYRYELFLSQSQERTIPQIAYIYRPVLLFLRQPKERTIPQIATGTDCYSLDSLHVQACHLDTDFSLDILQAQTVPKIATGMGYPLYSQCSGTSCCSFDSLHVQASGADFSLYILQRTFTEQTILQVAADSESIFMTIVHYRWTMTIPNKIVNQRSDQICQNLVNLTHNRGV